MNQALLEAADLREQDPVTVGDYLASWLDHARVRVRFDYSSESDHVRYPFGKDTRIEGGRNSGKNFSQLGNGWVLGPVIRRLAAMGGIAVGQGFVAHISDLVLAIVASRLIEANGPEQCRFFQIAIGQGISAGTTERTGR